MKEQEKKAGLRNSKKKAAKRPRRVILLLLNDNEIAAIVKVERIFQDTYPDNPFGVTVFCKALDSFGLIFDLDLTFSSETAEIKQRILADLKIDTIHLAKGRYNVFKKTSTVSLLDPEYMALPPDIKEKDVRKVLRVNSKSSLPIAQ